MVLEGGRERDCKIYPLKTVELAVLGLLNEVCIISEKEYR